MAVAGRKTKGHQEHLGGLAPLTFAGALPAPLPTRIEPALSTLAAVAPPGQTWLHEIKFDGYRILARVERGRVTLFTRKGNDWTARLPSLVQAIQGLPVQTALLDGELVVLDERGASDFGRLQDALSREPAPQAASWAYYVFDLLYLDGVDLLGVGLVQRKALLARTLARVSPAVGRTIRLSDHVVGQGPAFLAKVAAMGLEGIVSKQVDAPYRPGRSGGWLKIKCSHRQEFVVVGYTKPKGSRSYFGALLLASYAKGELVYRGRVGTGFSEDTLGSLHGQLAPLRDGQSKLTNPPKGAEARDVQWVKPELVAEISFSGFTQDGMVRHATFLGQREDKSGIDVVDEPS